MALVIWDVLVMDLMRRRISRVLGISKDSFGWVVERPGFFELLAGLL
jgi:hypothetical protein